MTKRNENKARKNTKHVAGVVVSIPGAGFFIVGVGGQRHPLDRETYTSGSAARTALATING